ncbi:hypothetical protein CRYO30217_03283 [Parvicella tangerina]|uniref:Uncharacterized protein n=1 Tax=Parvicella tangerina TaxID=2829795 RepID=A0A916JQR5_9FLAO|nr:hypothetical protein CRYO30217_03283 [Parvicella tangerina]
MLEEKKIHIITVFIGVFLMLLLYWIDDVNAISKGYILTLFVTPFVIMDLIFLFFLSKSRYNILLIYNILFVAFYAFRQLF